MGCVFYEPINQQMHTDTASDQEKAQGNVGLKHRGGAPDPAWGAEVGQVMSRLRSDAPVGTGEDLDSHSCLFLPAAQPAEPDFCF